MGAAKAAGMATGEREPLRRFGAMPALLSVEPLDGDAAIPEVIAGILDRLHTAERRLERATREADELRQQLAEAHGDARRDPLTGLANRRAFEEAFRTAIGGGAAVHLAMCDVDHFKRVNDRYGHAVADRVLKTIAGALSRACREHFVARYGGEEFVVLFTGIEQAEAVATLENARALVGATPHRLRENDAPLDRITLSAGLTCHLGAEPPAATFDRADRLLYAAKDAGRNRLCTG